MMKKRNNIRKDRISALTVAYYFLGIKGNGGITNLKLQKLVYYAQVWYFTISNKKLFSESIEAWMHGPAIPSLYHYFKRFGSGPIQVNDIEAFKFDFVPSQVKFLKNIWHIYGKYDALYLEALTHSELPWQIARRGLEIGDHSTNRINLKIAKEYYTKKLNDSK